MYGDNMKKRKKPIRKLALKEYNGSLITFKDYPLFDYLEICDTKIDNQEDYKIIIDACTLNKVTITNNTFLRTEFIDSTFINCDLTNNTFKESSFIRCEFIDCKLTGTHFIESHLEHIYINNTKAEFLDFADNKMKFIEINNTLLRESNWFENKIKDIEFYNNDLSLSTIYNNPFTKLDISTCDIEDMKIDIKSLKGLSIASYQAEKFCAFLGIKVN